MNQIKKQSNPHIYVYTVFTTSRLPGNSFYRGKSRPSEIPQTTGGAATVASFYLPFSKKIIDAHQITLQPDLQVPSRFAADVRVLWIFG
jgi:hypothetical protein